MSNQREMTNTTTITQIALFTSLQCIISPFSIVFPFSPVPVSFSTLMLYLSVYILGKKRSVISCGIYILIGLVGLPVFSGFGAGIGKVLGPTGGYLLGYFFLVYISGWFIEKWNRNPVEEMRSGVREIKGRRVRSYIMQGLGMALGTAVCYLFGTFWLAYQADMSFVAAVSVGVLPFLVTDVIKIVVAVLIGLTVRKRLVRAGVL